MVEAKRTLVKSGPELWAELSDPAALARHLEPFGAVRRRARGRGVVSSPGRASGLGAASRSEPSGWGTRVTLQADIGTSPGPEPPRPGFWKRLLGRRPPVPPPVPAMADDAALTALTDVLDALGRAHHRPFSRA